MKKSLLIAAFGLVSVGSYAQTFEEVPVNNSGCEYRIYTIPSLFCTDKYVVFRFYYGHDGDYNSYYNIYDKDFTLIKQFHVIEGMEPIYYLCCGEVYDTEHFYFTQSLFNDDDAFEYIETDRLRSEDSSFSYSTYLRVMSDNGKEVARITFDKPVTKEYMSLYLIAFGSKNYLLVDAPYSGDIKGKFQKLYLIDKNSSGQDAIREVEMPDAIKAFPALARKNQSVSIELGENAGGRLLVTSANGSVARQLPVKQGQTSVQLNTRGLASGVYVVSTVNASGKQENCKIVIK